MLLPASRKYTEVSNIRKSEKAVQWPGVSQASYGRATPSSGTTSLMRSKGERRKDLHGSQSEHEGRSERASERGGAGKQAQRPKKRKGIISAGCLSDRPWNAANLC
jgi:hypothetical protein